MYRVCSESSSVLSTVKVVARLLKCVSSSEQNTLSAFSLQVALQPGSSADRLHTMWS